MDRLIYGLFVTMIGMGTVFIALLFLIYVLKTMNKIINSNKKEKKPFPINNEMKTVEKKTEPQIAEQAMEIDESDDEELIAVIAAAVAASLNQSTHNIVVKSIRRIAPTLPSWSRAGKQDQIMNRL